MESLLKTATPGEHAVRHWSEFPNEIAYLGFITKNPHRLSCDTQENPTYQICLQITLFVELKPYLPEQLQNNFSIVDIQIN